MGRLTADPELKQTASSTPVTSFRIAVDRNFANKETGERQADFINIIAWRQTAEFICKYFRKGSMIAIEGSLQSRSYEDKNGNKRTSYDVVACNAYLAGAKADNAAQTSFAEPPEFEEVPDGDEDLPF